MQCPSLIKPRLQRHPPAITQMQLAETLGVSQQTMNAYEMGHRRVPVSALPRLARARSH
jgi:DNA-binding XRE family transcriptional regulator